MVQRRGRLRFAAKPRQRLRIRPQIVGKKLYWHEGVQARVLGFPDHAHAPASHCLDQPVVSDDLVRGRAGQIAGRRQVENVRRGSGKELAPRWSRASRNASSRICFVRSQRSVLMRRSTSGSS